MRRSVCGESRARRTTSRSCSSPAETVVAGSFQRAKKKPHEVAREEAWEEAGVRGQVRKKPLGYYTYIKKLRGDKLVPSLVQVHLVNVSELEQDYPEKGQRDLQWFSPEEAAAAVDEPELSTLLGRIRMFAAER
ncbi:NUDIX hydrolase [Rhizobium leguminosarum]|uniref:NUDIX hydrolase n=1 Tax=Rhizobium leguminosarum TaxID=384 RepID=UPI0028F41792|nr:NUDIX domain-containing protein [Rhizobium leguminosarum]